MEIEVGLRVSRPSKGAISTSLRITKDGSNPLFFYIETYTNLVLTANLKGYPKEKFKIEINEGGTQIAICGEKVMIAQVTTVGREAEVRRFRKVFRIPDGVDLDGISFTFNQEESVLKILMPKLVKGISGVRMEEVKEEDFDWGSHERTGVVADEAPERGSPRETLQKPTQLNKGEVPSSQETSARKDSDSKATSRAAEEKSEECEQGPGATASTEVEADQVTHGNQVEEYKAHEENGGVETHLSQQQSNVEPREAARAQHKPEQDDQTEPLKSDHLEEVGRTGNEIPAETDRVEPPEEKIDDRRGSLAPSQKSKLCSPSFLAGSAIVVSIIVLVICFTRPPKRR